MFISSKNIIRGGGVRDLGNFDYYKRYIILENPNITVINISSSTGRDKIGIMRDSERFQRTNLYHCYGNPIGYDGKIDPNSFITVGDISFSNHNYDLSRQRYAELLTSTSYNDLFNNTSVFETTPNIRFYSNSHQILNEDNFGNEFLRGNYYLPNPNSGIKPIESIRFGDLIDDHTTIMKSPNDLNFSKFHCESGEFNANQKFKEIDEYSSDYEIDLNQLCLLIIGPVTDLTLGLLVNELTFSFDSDTGMSGINYKTDHKMPSKLYLDQIHGNSMSKFQEEMLYICDLVGWKFRIFVKANIGSVRLKFIRYETFEGGYITKDFEFDLGKFRNPQHNDTITWLDGNIGF